MAGRKALQRKRFEQAKRNLALETAIDERRAARNRGKFFVHILICNLGVFFLGLVLWHKDGVVPTLMGDLASKLSLDWLSTLGIKLILALILAIALTFLVSKIWVLMVANGATLWHKAAGIVTLCALYIGILGYLTGNVVSVIGLGTGLIIPALLYWATLRRFV